MFIYFFPIFRYIQFFHIFVFPEELVTRKNLVSVIVSSVLEFICKFLIIIIFDNHFTRIIVDERDCTSQINEFFRGRSLFSLDVCHTHSLWINTNKAKIFGFTYVEDIRTPNKLFRIFFSILIRLYISYILSLLNGVEWNEEQVIFFRQQTWSYAASFLYDICLHININYFYLLFHGMKYTENYKSNCFKIINKDFVVDLI